MSLRRVCLFCVFAVATVNMAFGQVGATGTVLGTVTDSTGAVLPNVKVTVTNTATNAAFNTESNSAGDYNAPSLPPGSYTASAEGTGGFAKTVKGPFTRTVRPEVPRRFVLEAWSGVGNPERVAAQNVTLENTDTASLSQEISGEQVADLPLNGRNFMQLLLVGAGAVTVGGEQGTMRQGEGNAVSINGGRPEGNNYTLDGLVNTDQAMMTPAVVLSQDAIGEFKVQSGIYPAENGFGASQINIVSKGGTNSLHGAIYESNRNNAFDDSPFPTATDIIAGVKTSNPVLQLNQFGFVASGPVYIPKIYNGRNKTFWMANYEGWRMNNGARVESVNPTPAELGGDFSATTVPAVTGFPGGPLPAYGTPACTAVQNAGYDCLPADPTTGLNDWGTHVPAAFQTARVGLVAVANGFWSTPNVANTPEGTTNFITNIPGPLTMNQQTYRGDQLLGKYGSVFGRYTHAYYRHYHTQYNSGSINYGIEEYIQTEDAWEISHTISLGANNVNNFRFGKLRAQLRRVRPLRPLPWLAPWALRGPLPPSQPCRKRGRTSPSGPADLPVAVGR